MQEGVEIRSVKVETVMMYAQKRVLKINEEAKTLKELNRQYREAMEGLRALKETGLMTFKEFQSFQIQAAARYVVIGLELEK